MRTHEECLSFIEKMEAAYSQKRSDVSDNCAHFLSGQDKKIEFYTEVRYTYAELPVELTRQKVVVEYDSLTTLMMYFTPDETDLVPIWHECENHEYQND